jgi:hypothetical protein
LFAWGRTLNSIVAPRRKRVFLVASIGMLSGGGKRMVNRERLKCGFVSKPFGVVTGRFRNLVKRR